MNIRYPIYEGVYRILTIVFHNPEIRNCKNTPFVRQWRTNQEDYLRNPHKIPQQKTTVYFISHPAKVVPCPVYPYKVRPLRVRARDCQAGEK